MSIGNVRDSAPWGSASLPGRAGLRRARELTVTALCLVALLALGGCNLPDLGSADVDSDPAAPLPTPRPSETSWGGAPHQLPAGWSAYYAPHFTLALPPGWRVEAQWNAKDPQPEWWNMDYLLSSPQQQDARGGVFEWDAHSGVLVRDNFCRRTAGYEMGTVAGLSMRVGPPRGEPGEFDRNWTFIRATCEKQWQAQVG